MRRVFLLLAVAVAMTATMIPVPVFAQTGGEHCEDNTLPNGDLNVVCGGGSRSAGGPGGPLLGHGSGLHEVVDFGEEVTLEGGGGGQTPGGGGGGAGGRCVYTLNPDGTSTPECTPNAPFDH
jgi:hypothetical protein